MTKEIELRKGLQRRSLMESKASGQENLAEKLNADNDETHGNPPLPLTPKKFISATAKLELHCTYNIPVPVQIVKFIVKNTGRNGTGTGPVYRKDPLFCNLEQRSSDEENYRYIPVPSDVIHSASPAIHNRFHGAYPLHSYT